MSNSFSLYLDLLRLLAALTVLVAHTGWHATAERVLWPNSLGHNAVIVFFLLSGYVIAYVADTKERDARSFWVSRLARIYSVAVPALLLTLVADQIGLALHASTYANGMTTQDHWVTRMVASLLFVNELWLISIMPFSNSPYWSLCYEMSYYLLFALWAYGGERRWRWIALAALVIGPKILLLAPIWMLGAALYHWKPPPLARLQVWLLWLASTAAILAYVLLDLGAPLTAWTRGWLGATLHHELHFSKHFLGDYLLSLLMAAHFVAAREAAEAFAPLWRVGGRAIRWAAGYTFSIYLFHLPLVIMFGAALHEMPRGPLRFALVVGGALIIVLVVGHFTEQRKEPLRRWLDRHLPRVAWTARVGSRRA
jgi:peptidoglycan/LPS O-acetylase OafA/YrhL